MRTRAKTVAPVDQASIAKRIAALTARPSMTLYNPSPDWVASEVAGQMFYIPPDLGGAPVEHPVDCVGIKQHTRRNDIEENDLTPEMVSGTGELHIGDYITSRGIKSIGVELIALVTVQNYAERGVVLLDLDARKAEREKKSALAVYEQWRRKSAQHQVQAWGEVVANFQKNPANKGKLLTPPQRVRESQEFLDSSADSGDAFKYVCDYGDYATNDPLKYSRHMKAQHRETVETEVPKVKKTARQEAASAA